MVLIGFFGKDFWDKWKKDFEESIPDYEDPFLETAKNIGDVVDMLADIPKQVGDALEDATKTVVAIVILYALISSGGK